MIPFFSKTECQDKQNFAYAAGNTVAATLCWMMGHTIQRDEASAWDVIKSKVYCL